MKGRMNVHVVIGPLRARFLSVHVIAGLLALTTPASSTPDDPPPTEAELLTIPGPERPPSGSGQPDPFALLPTMPNNLGISNDGAISFDNAAGIIQYHGEVRVLADNGIQLFADHALLDTKKKFIRVTGKVSIYQGTILHRGDTAVYHYEEGKLDASQLRASLDPVLLEAGRFRTIDQDGQQVYIGEDAGLTTHDAEDPSYWLRARQTTILPGDRVIFRDVKLHLGDTPVFWLPYLSQPLNGELGYQMVPGARSNWGPFLLNRYGIMLGSSEDPITGKRSDGWLLAQFHANLLARRGLGTGIDLFDTRLEDNENLGWLKLFYINDLDPSLERGGERRGFVNEDRFRVQLRHRLELDIIPGGDTYLDADISYLSDRYFLEDYDIKSFRLEPNPDNLLALVHQRDRNLFTLWARMRLNTFYQSDTRYPEIAIDQTKGSIFGSSVLHQGTTLFGIYDEYNPGFTATALEEEATLLSPGNPRLLEIDHLLADRGFTRFHTWQELSLPLKIGNWLNVVPKAGVGFTSYQSVEGPAGAANRTHAFVGADASIKLSRRYPDIQSDRWGLDGLLHVVQPYGSVSFLSTDELDEDFPRIDRLTPTTRPRPLSVGRFTAIDDLEDWSIVRLGVRNSLLTHRDSSSHEWLTLDTYMDWFIDDPEFDREFSSLYNDLRWHPIPWLDLALETQFPILNSEDDFTEIAGTLHFMPTDDLELSIRQRFLYNHPILENSTLLEVQAYNRFSDKWGAGFRHRWQFDDGTLEYQSYSLHRNFDSWAISFGLFFRDNRVEDEYGFVLGFTLKDFPSLSLPLKVGVE